MNPTLKEIMKERVPECYRNDSALTEYLEVCGELLDELKDTVKLHDTYNDYRRVPESRLSMLARKFALDPPRNIPEEMMRGIVRDIIQIYSSKGSESSLVWIFRLLGWRANFEYAWLINPERYEPNIRDVYPNVYEKLGLESDVSVSNSILLRIGEGYRIGVEDQLYAFDDNFLFDGYLRIGRNPLTFTGGGDVYDPFTPSSVEPFSTDFNKIDWRNFVYGKERVQPDGTFFYGRTPFSSFNNLREVRIIGEEYSDTSPRFRDVVMKTPYIIVEVNAQDYDKFTQPYEDDGIIYNYTESETYQIAETLINYFLFDSVRPSPIKVILIASRIKEEDTFFVSESLNDEFTSEPLELGVEQSDITDLESYGMTLDTDSDLYEIGTAGLYVGSPSFMPVNSLSVIPMGAIGDLRTEYEFDVASDTWNYTISHDESYFTEHAVGEFVSPPYPLRTPCSFDVTVNQTGATLQVAVGVDDDFVDWGVLSTGTTSFTASHDYNRIRVKTSDASGISVTVTTTWESQVGYDLPADHPQLIAA